MAQIRFVAPSKVNGSVLAECRMIVDELPGVEFGGMAILKPAEKKNGKDSNTDSTPRVTLSPVFAPSAGALPAGEPTYTKAADGTFHENGVTASAEGTAACELLSDRILELWVNNKGSFGTYGV